uniref:Uncharacterized protein n=1 Tax=viral metagenome TaxID=1070528 RepID=A0A6M3IIC5_9ZZZZ
MTKKKQIKEPAGFDTKYSVVLRFWSTPQELGVVDIVYYQNAITKKFFYKLIDYMGRMWENVPEDDLIIIENIPGKKAIESFNLIKKQSIEESKKFMIEPGKHIDVSIS